MNRSLRKITRRKKNEEKKARWGKMTQRSSKRNTQRAGIMAVAKSIQETRRVYSPPGIEKAPNHKYKIQKKRGEEKETSHQPPPGIQKPGDSQLPSTKSAHTGWPSRPTKRKKPERSDESSRHTSFSREAQREREGERGCDSCDAPGEKGRRGNWGPFYTSAEPEGSWRGRFLLSHSKRETRWWKNRVHVYKSWTSDRRTWTVRLEYPKWGPLAEVSSRILFLHLFFYWTSQWEISWTGTGWSGPRGPIADFCYRSTEREFTWLKYPFPELASP